MAGRARPDGRAEVVIPLLVTARAGVNDVGPVEGGRLRVRVTAAPAGDEANEAALRALAEALDVPRRDVRLVSGGASRRKLASVAGPGADAVAARFPGLTRGRAG